MENIIFWGYGYEGVLACWELCFEKRIYEYLGFADNSCMKQGNYVYGRPIYSLEDLINLKEKERFVICVCSNYYAEIDFQLRNKGLKVDLIYREGKLERYRGCYFDELDFSKPVKFYAGDIYDSVHLKDDNLFGLSVDKCDEKHIYHDIRKSYPIPDNSIDAYMAEHVLEHIEFECLIDAINEIHRILKPGATFRLVLPDYNSLRHGLLCMRDKDNSIIWDANDGTKYNGTIKEGAHCWFPTYEIVNEVLKKTKFNEYTFLKYYETDHSYVLKEMDFKNGYLVRHYLGENACEMCIDCIK